MSIYPIGSMYGIFTYIGSICIVNVDSPMVPMGILKNIHPELIDPADLQFRRYPIPNNCSVMVLSRANAPISSQMVTTDPGPLRTVTP